MYLFFLNGGIIHLRKASTWRITSGFLEPMTSRAREIGRWPLSALAGWCYDNEELTHYHFAEKTSRITDL